MNAYLDPGSGSMLLGLIASGMAGIVVIFKTFGHRIMSALTFWKKDEPEFQPSATPEDGVDHESASSPT